MLNIRFSTNHGHNYDVNIRAHPHEVTIAEVEWLQRTDIALSMRLKTFFDQPEVVDVLPEAGDTLSHIMLELTLQGCLLEYVPNGLPESLVWEIDGQDYKMTPERVLELYGPIENLTVADYRIRSEEMGEFSISPLAIPALLQPETLESPKQKLTWKQYVDAQFFTLRVRAVEKHIQDVDPANWVEPIMRSYLNQVAWPTKMS